MTSATYFTFESNLLAALDALAALFVAPLFALFAALGFVGRLCAAYPKHTAGIISVLALVWFAASFPHMVAALALIATFAYITYPRSK